jgi:DHA1 family bicyclomycin/chloramphenicol resistance-like MFS transporter
MSPAPIAKRRMTPGAVVITLVLLLGIQPITTDLYLPALPNLQQDFAASVAETQLTLSALIIAFGFAQLLCGPLADRFGRRPVLLNGLALYTLASGLAALAPSIEWLIGWRALQGAAMAAAVTCGRSIVRDLYEPQQGARVLSRGMGGLGLIAFASPLMGGAIVHWFNWHAAMLVPALFGAASLAFITLRFVESVPQTNREATRLAPLLRNWWQIVSHPTFRAYTLLMCMTYAGLFTMLAASSFVYIGVLGLSRLACGAILAVHSLFYVVGTVLCRRLLLRYGLRPTVAIGGAFSLAGGLITALLSLIGAHHVSAWSAVAPIWLFMIGHGIHQPCGQAGAVGPFPDKAGTAASVSGFFMMAVAFAVGLFLGRHLNGTVFPLTLGLGAFGIGAATVAWTLVRRHGEPARSAVATQPL